MISHRGTKKWTTMSKNSYLHKVSVDSSIQLMHMRMSFIQLELLCNYLQPIMLQNSGHYIAKETHVTN